MNQIVRRLPRRFRRLGNILMFVGPALLLLAGAYLVPALLTVQESMLDRRTGEFVGLDNYVRAASDAGVREALFNSLVFWLLIPALVIITLGILFAALTDQLRPRWEALAKSVIFMPLAISSIGAAAIWFLMYAYQPAGQPQIGVFNQIVTQLGGSPIPWLIRDGLHLNTMLLMLIVVWGSTGFAMVMMSAAIKGVPQETIEAARMDGVGGVRTFIHVVLPQIWPTVVVVFTTIALLGFRSFEIVYAMTGGEFGTDVVGNRFFLLLFPLRDRPLAAVVVVLMLLPAIPIIVANIRRQRRATA